LERLCRQPENAKKPEACGPGLFKGNGASGKNPYGFFSALARVGIEDLSRKLKSLKVERMLLH
jgi:hypothetical protein